MATVRPAFLQFSQGDGEEGEGAQAHSHANLPRSLQALVGSLKSSETKDRMPRWSRFSLVNIKAEGPRT